MNSSESTAKTPQSSLLTAQFEHKRCEAKLSEAWQAEGLFEFEKAKDPNAPVFNIAMPPPNANGELHLGHSFGYTVMDILGRFHRLLGERVLLLPGKDHAGIQTQVVYEKKLKAEGTDYTKIPASDLFKSCYDFCIDRSHYMRNQEKRLGISADWSKELFTLDERLTKIVYETFTKLWHDGLVYKGHRIVNWSVFSQTSISDVEVEYREEEGVLWYLRYPLVGSAGPDGVEIKLPSGAIAMVGGSSLITATTRPETMLGDTALAVHPDDERYKALIGRWVRVPLTGREIQVVGDERIDPKFGTGVVKVTPAHDFTDYDIGQTHSLPIIQVIGKDGRMTAEAGASFAGLEVKKCREKVLENLVSEGFLLDEQKMRHKVPIGERGKDVIEPLISEQWFIQVDKPGNSLRQNALSAIKSGKIKIFPERFQVLFEQWFENLRDWNISRQLWWGHRLPVWYREVAGKKETYVGSSAPQGDEWTQETDVFDTWFSSGQWPFSTMAAHTLLDVDADQKTSAVFPTHTMVMGRDILLFWACRMVLLTVYRTGEVPWKNIYFTGLIRDEHGQKMAKSKGNGIDPLATIDKFGTDALRLGLVMGCSPGNDLNLSERKIEGYSKFTNKIWNSAKLIDIKVRDHAEAARSFTGTPKLEINRWIVAEVERLHLSVTQKLEVYDISLAAMELYNSTWQLFCDWYLECMKVLIDKGTPEDVTETAHTAISSFRSLLTLWHPFLPFVTEEIYQQIDFLREGPFLASASWKTVSPAVGTPTAQNPAVVKMQEIVTSIRSVKAALLIPHKQVRVAYDQILSAEMQLLVSELARVEFVAATAIAPELALRKPLGQANLMLKIEGKEKYREKLEKDAAANRISITSMEGKLSGAFAKNAKPDLVEKEREKLVETKAALTQLEQELAAVR